MSTTTVAPAASVGGLSAKKRHRLLLALGYAISVGALSGIAYYGRDYYLLDAAQRPYSPLHDALKPSGTVGLRLGLVGLCMFLAIFLYPLRKRWTWLASIGNTRNWMDFHILLGVTAPFVIALHSSFKFRGFAGIAYWIMVAVALSGVVGRYLYGQIPRRVNATELSLKESQDILQRMIDDLGAQKYFAARDVERVLRLPDATTVSRMPVVLALLYMVLLDMSRPFRVAWLRSRALSAPQILLSVGGLLRSGNQELERVIDIARDQASLSKRLLFLSRAQRVFHLWHVVHKPFSYTFALLALIHIGVVWMLGYI